MMIINEIKRMQQLAGLNEAFIDMPEYYAVINPYGESDDPPLYIITNSKADMIHKLNSAINYFRSKETEDPRKWNFSYDISDLDEEARIINGQVFNHYIWDDWTSVTDDEDVFNKEIDNLETKPKAYKEQYGTI
jgi:hypothetical protein